MQFLYLLLSIYLGRKNPLYYLIFPIALVSGQGAFIDPRTVLFADDLFLFGKNIYKDVVIVYLFLVVFLLRKRWNISIVSKTPMILYGLFIFLLILLTFISSGTGNEALNIMRLFTHMILGYFLLLLIFSTTNSKQFISFFNTLFVATGILSICYVINSANIFPFFYQENLYQEIEWDQGSFFRDFSTIPYFSHLLFILAITHILFQSKDFNQKAILFCLLPYPFVSLYTFTRSLLDVIIIECVLIILIFAIKSPRRIFKTTLIYIVLAFFIIIGIVQTTFKEELNYYTSRVESVKDEGAKEDNVLIRIAYHVKAFDIVKTGNSLLIGDGINKKHEQEMDTIGAWTVDSTIPFFLIFTGVLGVIFYFYIGIHFIYRTIVQLRRNFNPFSLTLFVIILSWLISSLIMGGYRWGDPFIFFPLVLVVSIDKYVEKRQYNLNISNKATDIKLNSY